MKKSKTSSDTSRPSEMSREYDFKAMSGGVRGKYHKSYRKGHTVKIRKADGSSTTQHFKVADGAVILERDVREFFPNAESVNDALRCLIPLLRKKRTRSGKDSAASHRE